MTEFKDINITNTPMSTSLCISPSIMSLKEYFISIFETNDSKFTDEWGWFIDIEYNNSVSSLFKNNKYNKNISKYVFKPSTINENIGIRSLKSIDNLYNTSLMFEMDEDYENENENKNKKTSNSCLFKLNICCLICIITYCILL
jgi:hypothetical protein